MTGFSGHLFTALDYTLKFRATHAQHWCPQSRLHCLCLIATSNGGRSPSSGFPTVPGLRYQLLTATAHNDWTPVVLWLQIKNQNYVTTDGQSASLSWCQALIWGPRPDFYYCKAVAGLLMWGALSDEKTSLSFTIAADNRQSIHFWVLVPRDS
jgi:hypothetical protein